MGTPTFSSISSELSATGTGSAETLGLNSFASGELTLNQQTWSVAHGLGGTPAIVRVVLVVTTAGDATGYPVGRETDAAFWYNSSVNFPAFAVTVDTSNIYMSSFGNPTGNEQDFAILNATGTNYLNPTSFNNFRLKIYALR